MASTAALIQFPRTPVSADTSSVVGQDSSDKLSTKFDGISPTIREAYASIEATVAERGSQFSVRPSQVKLSQLVFEACLSRTPLAAEAPTGTGKTLAYLIGALAAAKETGLPIVVATATVALQRQMTGKDFSLLRAAGLTSSKDWALMLGRGRYFCPRSAHSLLDSLNAAGARQSNLFDDLPDSPPKLNPEIPVLLQDLIKAAEDGSWRGDRDTWAGDASEFDALWPQVCADADTCSGKKCEFYESGCRFFKDRARATTASVLITNHDLVLADLRLRAADVPDPLFPFEQYILIFDEAHQLPEKALNSATAHLSEKELGHIGRDLPGLLDRVYASAWLQAGLTADGQTPQQLDATRLAGLLQELHKLTAEFALSLDTHVTFGREQPPVELVKLAEALALALEPILAGLKALGALFRAGSDSSETPANQRYVEQLVARLSGQVRRCYAGALGFCMPDGQARWLEFTSEGHVLCTSPLTGGEVLPALLWRTKFPVCLVSATLRTLGNFDAFSRDCALPPETKLVCLESPFDYARSFIDLYAIGASPGAAEFEDALVAALSTILDPAEGTLVLFTSYARMRRVVNKLPPRLASLVLVQGSAPVTVLLNKHRQRIAKGYGSFLFGTDTFSEGIDLPGALCSHVVITQLPFPQFGSPLEVSRRLEQGDQHFQQHFLPATSRKLQQGAGRLIRRESDQGRISILDSRIRRKYGAALLGALPPFTNRGLRIINEALSQDGHADTTMYYKLYCDIAGDYYAS